nr:hypothetical protein [uncultured Agathobaculum sp.]
MNNTTDLKIRIVSRLATTQQILLYQEDIQTNVKNFLTAAWEHPHIAPRAKYEVTLPMQIGVSAAEDIGSGRVTTKQLTADYNTAWEIYDNEQGLDIREASGPAPSMDTIEVLNSCEDTKFAMVTKDSKPLFACEVRPDFRVNFAIHPKLYVALSDMEIHEEFFDAATLSRAPEIIDYEGQQYITIYLDEDVSSGKVTITYDFAKFN